MTDFKLTYMEAMFVIVALVIMLPCMDREQMSLASVPIEQRRRVLVSHTESFEQDMHVNWAATLALPHIDPTADILLEKESDVPIGSHITSRKFQIIAIIQRGLHLFQRFLVDLFLSSPGVMTPRMIL